MSDTPTILAIDASSTAIGWVLYAGKVLSHGELQLTGADITDRCRQAYNQLWTLLERYTQPDVLAIEAPVARYGKAVIPQSRVAGALLALAGQRSILVLEVSPTEAKRALCGRGQGEKIDMQVAALSYKVSGEHAADALGVAIVAAGKIQVVA
jgi:Holliday junction resolvasome RuvABC endonuclease subunit